MKSSVKIKILKTIEFRDECDYKSNKIEKVNIIQRLFFAGYETLKNKTL